VTLLTIILAPSQRASCQSAPVCQDGPDGALRAIVDVDPTETAVPGFLGRPLCPEVLPGR
jgi:hypothetical protein